MISRPVQSDMGHSFTVLFVEDLAAMRELVAHMLGRQGYTILTAADGYEALRILVERPVDLLLTDIRMPGISGVQLAAQAKLIRPHLRVLYTTGYAEEARDPSVLRYGKLLPKPLRPAELAWEIEQALMA
jgi:two-component system cell cycle sensor histidine kinase/response regulator CckA